jgi:hypothetical protein
MPASIHPVDELPLKLAARGLRYVIAMYAVAASASEILAQREPPHA